MYQNTTSVTPNTNTRLCVYTTTGTAAITTGSATITGTGTSFTTEYRLGDDVIVNNERRRVIAITSNTSMTVDIVYNTTNPSSSVQLYPQEYKGENKIITIIAHDTNAANIWVGQTLNALRDGTDVSATSRSIPIQPIQPIGPITCSNLYEVFVLSPSASQKFSILINQ
jgi:hypothetical protein